MADTYWLDAGGNPWIVDDNSSPDVGWTEIDLATYNTTVTALQMDADAVNAATELAACTLRKQAYDDLKASVHTSDWPESLFFFLTQFTPGDC